MGEIFDLTLSVSEGFPTYFSSSKMESTFKESPRRQISYFQG